MVSEIRWHTAKDIAIRSYHRDNRNGVPQEFIQPRIWLSMELMAAEINTALKVLAMDGISRIPFNHYPFRWNPEVIATSLHESTDDIIHQAAFIAKHDQPVIVMDTILQIIPPFLFLSKWPAAYQQRTASIIEG